VPKLEQLVELLKADPNDSFIRYGIAMEYAKQGNHAQAIAEFAELIRRDPKYVPAYFMGGRAYAQNGDVEGARGMYQRGVQVAQQVGDTHAAGEIAEALAMLE
jgi:Tfp pilus assembly protein PilF